MRLGWPHGGRSFHWAPLQPRKIVRKRKSTPALGGYVIKTYRGKPFLAKKPTFTKPWSEGQANWRKTFSEANGFANIVKADPALQSLYKRRGVKLKLNYRQMALRDFFNPPRIAVLNQWDYRPEQGGVLRVLANDDFEVVGVWVALRDRDGNVTAGGEARFTGKVWEFNVPPRMAGSTPLNIEVAARDRPGNVVTRTFPVERDGGRGMGSGCGM